MFDPFENENFKSNDAIYFLDMEEQFWIKKGCFLVKIMRFHSRKILGEGGHTSNFNQTSNFFPFTW